MQTLILALMPLMFMLPTFAQDLDPDLVALVGRHRLVRGDKNCPDTTLIERVRSEPTLVLKDLSPSLSSAEFLAFDGINAGRITYDQGYRSYKQRMTVYEAHTLKKLQRSCTGVFVINCTEWKMKASMEIISSQSFALRNGRMSCFYEAI